MCRKIKKCRICGNTELVSVLNLGEQALTGVFPKSKDETITTGTLELVKCCENKNGGNCGLLQLRHSFDLNEMYGDNYGYRSGLNKSMAVHLQGKVKRILEMVDLVAGDLIVDIGSNDSTLLQAYPQKGLTLTGIDPAEKKFRHYYPKHIQLIPAFFSAQAVQRCFPERKAKVITSIAMFYDLSSPLDFVRDIFEILDEDGIWVFEQSYMPTMLEVNAYDTVCHEHLEYYSLQQIKWMTDRVGLKIIDVEFNRINGGSFSVTVAKERSPYRENTALIEEILQKEKDKGLGTVQPYEEFKKRVYRHRDDMRQFMNKLKASGKKIIGYGASTKGNVVLQFCKLTSEDIPYIAEVNEDKFGCYTPGTLIPIISDVEARKMKPDYLFVLPWHFKDNFLKREKEYLKSGGKLIMPLPEIEVIEF